MILLIMSGIVILKGGCCFTIILIFWRFARVHIWLLGIHKSWLFYILCVLICIFLTHLWFSPFLWIIKPSLISSDSTHQIHGCLLLCEDRIVIFPVYNWSRMIRIRNLFCLILIFQYIGSCVISLWWFRTILNLRWWIAC